MQDSSEERENASQTKTIATKAIAVAVVIATCTATTAWLISATSALADSATSSQIDEYGNRNRCTDEPDGKKGNRNQNRSIDGGGTDGNENAEGIEEYGNGNRS